LTNYIPMEILIVEDTKTIANNIASFLQWNGRHCTICETCSDAISHTKHKTYDCFLVDIMLPDGDGISLAKTLRSMSDMPIIMTTAKWSIDDKQAAFDAWADDYLVKPFSLKELVMRINAHAKRSVTEQDPAITIGDVRIQIQEKRVYKQETHIPLTIKERHIIELLVQRLWQTVSRTDIIEHIWGGDALFWYDATLDVYIAKIRKKIGKDVIETVKWFGYCIPK